MAFYRLVKALFWTAAVLCVLLFLAGQKQPQCNLPALLLVPVCLLLHWLQKRLWMRANQRMPLVCVQATLVNHRQVYEGARMQGYKCSYLTFATEKGELLEFVVPREAFDCIQLGAKGPLEYRGGMYVSFRKVQN